MIKPTVGRIVWWRPARGNGPTWVQERAAIIVDTDGDRMVNLVVFEADGTVKAFVNVLFIQPDEVPPRQVSYAEWMPFQKGQAQKTEALEAAARQVA